MKASSNRSIGFTGLLAVLFIGLKLSNAVAWSWWWVLAPIWITGIFWTVAGLVTLWILKR